MAFLKGLGKKPLITTGFSCWRLSVALRGSRKGLLALLMDISGKREIVILLSGWNKGDFMPIKERKSSWQTLFDEY